MTREQVTKGQRILVEITKVESALTKIKTARVDEVKTNHGSKIDVEWDFRDDVTEALAKCYKRKLKDLESELSAI